MKKSLFIFTLCYVLIGCNISNNTVQSSMLLFEFKPIENINNLTILQDLTEIYKQESVILKNYSPYDNILRIFIFTAIILIVLVVVSTPLLLIYFWIDNFFEVQKLIIQIKKRNASSQFMEVEENTWSVYKKSYSAMYGNAFGIAAWIFFTYFYVSIYYTDFNAGIIDYFRFPFKIMESLSGDKTTLNNHIPSEMWISMLFIVGISAVHYFLGRFVGRFISTNFHKKLYFKS